MRVLMFGWEFPPASAAASAWPARASCGACSSSTRRSRWSCPAAPPRPPIAEPPHRPGRRGRAAGARTARRGRPRRALRVRRVRTPAPALHDRGAYARGADSRRSPARPTPRPTSIYGPDLPREVLRYAAARGRIAAREPFDVIHAHDWLTFLAGVEARRVQRKAARPPRPRHRVRPLGRRRRTRFVTAHRAGRRWPPPTASSPSPATPRTCSSTRYGVPRRAPPRRAQRDRPAGAGPRTSGRGDRSPLVLFAGRITSQKGPELLRRRGRARGRRDAATSSSSSPAPATACARCASASRRAASRERFLFTGFLPPEELDRLYARADVYVMPSLSEPFGLTALEALQHGTPVIVSRTAGVAEVVPQRPARRLRRRRGPRQPRSCRSCCSRRCASALSRARPRGRRSGSPGAIRRGAASPSTGNWWENAESPRP